QRLRRTRILTCPTCYSHRAIFLNANPPSARCADCDSTYKFKTVKPNPAQDDQEQPVEPSPRKKRGKNGRPPITPAPPINARDFGALTDYINDALQRGPEGFRRAQREATRFARRFGLTYLEPQWFACTPWLKEWASGALGTRANGVPLTNGTEQWGERGSRVRVRVAISW